MFLNTLLCLLDKGYWRTNVFDVLEIQSFQMNEQTTTRSREHASIIPQMDQKINQNSSRYCCTDPLSISLYSLSIFFWCTRVQLSWRLEHISMNIYGFLCMIYKLTITLSLVADSAWRKEKNSCILSAALLCIFGFSFVFQYNELLYLVLWTGDITKNMGKNATLAQDKIGVLSIVPSSFFTEAWRSRQNGRFVA